MKGGKAPLGYTIVEVMIVLAVSGMMLVIASQFINDKQARTTFEQGVNDMATRIQNTIQEVSNGQYTDMQVYCSVNYAANRTTFSLTPSASTTKDCTYMGKLFHFVQDRGSMADEEQYELFTLAGARLDDSSPQKPVVDIDQSAISPVIDTTTNPIEQMLTRQEIVPYHLRIKRVYVDDTGWHYGIGFIQGLGELEDTGGLKTGPGTVKLYAARGLTRFRTTAEAVDVIKPYASGVGLREAKEVVICITDERRYAELILGRNNNALSVTVNMKGTETCIRSGT